jgi:hypothetical protein
MTRLVGIVVSVLVILAAYVGGYFICSNYREWSHGGLLGDSTAWRQFDDELTATIYTPLVRLEGVIRDDPSFRSEVGNPFFQVLDP